MMLGALRFPVCRTYKSPFGMHRPQWRDWECFAELLEIIKFIRIICSWLIGLHGDLRGRSQGWIGFEIKRKCVWVQSLDACRFLRSSTKFAPGFKPAIIDFLPFSNQTAKNRSPNGCTRIYVYRESLLENEWFSTVTRRNRCLLSEARWEWSGKAGREGCKRHPHLTIFSQLDV